MKINLQTGLASHSAAAKSPAKLISFLQAVFNLKAPAAKTMADTLVHISKEKALVTPAIDAFLEYAKTAKQPDIEKAIKSKTVQNLKPVLVSIVKNKTFAGTIAAVKKFKFKAPASKSVTAKAPSAGGDSKKASVRSLKASSNFDREEALTILLGNKILTLEASKNLSDHALESIFDAWDEGDAEYLHELLEELLYDEDEVNTVRGLASAIAKAKARIKKSAGSSNKKEGPGMEWLDKVSTDTKAQQAHYDAKGKVLSSYANFTRYLIDNEEDGHYAKAFNLLLGIKTKDAGIANNEAEEGLYAMHMKTRDVVYLLDPKSSPSIIKQLGQKVEANSYIVYTDTFEDGEGPFNGTLSPILGTAIALPFKEALAEFVHQVTLPAPIQKPSSAKTPTPVLKPTTTAAKSLPYKTIQKLAEALFDVNDADEEFGVKARTKWFNTKFGTNFKSIIIEHLEADDVTVIDFITKSNVRTRIFSVAYAKHLARSLGLSGTQNDIGLVTIVRNKPVKNTARVNPLFASAMREVMIMS